MEKITTPELINENSHLSFKETLYIDLHVKNFSAAAYKILLRPEGLATFLCRSSMAMYKKGKLGWVVSMICWRLNILLSGCDIHPNAKAGPGLTLVHCVGIVIGNSILGRDVKLYQGVTVGQKMHGMDNGVNPIIENNVIIYAGAVIVGDITIGSGSVIGANAVVTRSVPENSIVRAPFAEIKVKA